MTSSLYFELDWEISLYFPSLSLFIYSCSTSSSVGMYVCLPPNHPIQARHIRICVHRSPSFLPSFLHKHSSNWRFFPNAILTADCGSNHPSREANKVDRQTYEHDLTWMVDMDGTRKEAFISLLDLALIRPSVRFWRNSGASVACSMRDRSSQSGTQSISLTEWHKFVIICTFVGVLKWTEN